MRWKRRIAKVLLAGTRWILPTCRQASRWVSDAGVRKLSLLERLRLYEHLLLCRFCRRYRRQVLLLRQVLQRAAAEEPVAVARPLDPSARERLIAVLRQLPD